MSNQNALFSLSSKLAAHALALEAMLASGEERTSFLVVSLRKKVKVLAADYQAAEKEPQPITPYGWRNKGDAS